MEAKELARFEYDAWIIICNTLINYDKFYLVFILLATWI